MTNANAGTLGTFPQPPQRQTVTLPGGATLTSMAQLPRGLSEDCSVAFNLMLQLGVVFGSLECLIRLFKFVGAFVEVVDPAPDPVEVGRKILDMGPAARDVLECMTAYTPLGLCPPVKDALLLVRRYLGCLVEMLDSVVNQKLDIQVRMGDAQSQGNEELAEVLQLAQNNADLMGLQSLRSCEPAFGMLQMVGGLVQALTGQSLTLPSIDDLAGGELNAALQPLRDVLTMLDAVISLLPC